MQDIISVLLHRVNLWRSHDSHQRRSSKTTFRNLFQASRPKNWPPAKPKPQPLPHPRTIGCRRLANFPGVQDESNQVISDSLGVDVQDVTSQLISDSQVVGVPDMINHVIGDSQLVDVPDKTNQVINGSHVIVAEQSSGDGHLKKSVYTQVDEAVIFQQDEEENLYEVVEIRPKKSSSQTSLLPVSVSLHSEPDHSKFLSLPREALNDLETYSQPRSTGPAEISEESQTLDCKLASLSIGDEEVKRPAKNLRGTVVSNRRPNKWLTYLRHNFGTLLASKSKDHVPKNIVASQVDNSKKVTFSQGVTHSKRQHSASQTASASLIDLHSDDISSNEIDQLEEESLTVSEDTNIENDVGTFSNDHNLQPKPKPRNKKMYALQSTDQPNSCAPSTQTATCCKCKITTMLPSPRKLQASALLATDVKYNIKPALRQRIVNVEHEDGQS